MQEDTRRLIIPHRRRCYTDVTTYLKLKHVLDFSSSEEKVTRILGIDVTAVREFQAQLLEERCNRQRLVKPSIQNKRNSQKALLVLGLDPSQEKLKRTLGIDDDNELKVEQQRIEALKFQLMRRRSISAPLNKRNSSKALSMLGINPLDKAAKIFGEEEEVLLEARQEQLQKLEEYISKRRDSLATLNKKNIQKALNVIGYDPSLEKVLHNLGVDAGSAEEQQIRTIVVPEGKPVHLVGKYSNSKAIESNIRKWYILPVIVVAIFIIVGMMVTFMSRDSALYHFLSGY